MQRTKDLSRLDVIPVPPNLSRFRQGLRHAVIAAAASIMVFGPILHGVHRS
jgi:hypothetical protein